MRLPKLSRRRVIALGAAVTVVAVAAGTVAACRPPAKRLTGAAAPATVAAGRAGPIGGVSASAAPSASASPTAGPKPAGCTVFPADNVWHAQVVNLAVHPNSAAYISHIGPTAALHPDFGAAIYNGQEMGIPITVVPPDTPAVPVTFEESDESDRGPYPIPAGARVEGGDDHHVIAWDQGACKAYELYSATRAGGGFHAYSGAVFDLRSNRMRPLGHTSADAAGLSILAGLVRYDEVAAGRIDHAIRFTVSSSFKNYVWPASHKASSNADPAAPPMGLRVRLKASVDISKLPVQARVIAEAMKRYGMIVADNGSNWFFSGAPDKRWNDDQLNTLKTLHGKDFEVVDESGLMVSPTSYAVRG
jgi:hypothetical protein